jgi:hypothetical protein
MSAQPSSFFALLEDVMKSFLTVGLLSVSLGSAAAQSPEELAKLAKDLEKGGLSSKGDLAQVALVKMGPAAAAAVPHVVPLLSHKSRDVRFRAIKVLAAVAPGGHQEVFKQAALKETDHELGMALAAGITGEPELADLVRSAPRAAREAAAVRLADSPLLVEIATTSTDLQVRGDAIFALGDRSVLSRLAKEDPSADVQKWAAAALSADRLKDLAIGKVSCQRTPWAADQILCDITVTNQGSAAYEDLVFRMRGVAAGEWRGAGRIEPGETKKYNVMGGASTYAGTAYFDVLSAWKYRPR